MTEDQKATILAHLQNYRGLLLVKYEHEGDLTTYHELREVNETIHELHE